MGIIFKENIKIGSVVMSKKIQEIGLVNVLPFYGNLTRRGCGRWAKLVIGTTIFSLFTWS